MEDLLNAALATLRAQLQNEFLTGGALLVVFTGVLALLRNAPKHAWEVFKRNVVTRIDIADHDPAFYWVQRWLGEHPYTKTRARLLTASTRTMPVPGRNEPKSSAPDDGTRIVFSPAPGRHLLRFRSGLVLLERVRREGDSTLGEVAYHETFTFYALSRRLIKDLILEARAAACPPEDSRVAILRPHYGGWRTVQRREPRSFDSVILPGETMQEIRDDLQTFFGSRTWYAEHGIPYQRGYLLAGPPGAGKTSTVVALAAAFRRDIYIVSLSVMNDQQMANLMMELPEHALLLIEDVDCVFTDRQRLGDPNTTLSFSGFLNAIDGVSSPSGRVLIMTTNHPERLDPALVRPGRVDRRFAFCNATPDMATRLFLQFFPSKPGLAEMFGEAVARSEPVSMATLQERLIFHRYEPLMAAQYGSRDQRASEAAE